jgi:hypothetical protein
MKRNLAAATVAVAIVVGGATGWAIAGVGTSHDKGAPPRATTGSSPSTTPTAAQTVRASNGDTIVTTPTAQIVRFSATNGDIKKASDVTKLHLTSDEFRTFISGELIGQKASCPDAEITVDRFAISHGDGTPRDFAVGGEGGCGGAATLWTDEYGDWKQIFATQDTWYCQVLQRYHVPDGLIDHCADNPGTPPTTTGPVKILTFHSAAHPGAGVYIQSQSGTTLIPGTSQAFRDFIGTMAQTNTDLNTAKKLCEASGVGITVDSYATNSYALGAVNDCGGYVAIWGDIGYGWQELMSSQQEFNCQQLHDNGVPVGLVPGDNADVNLPLCYDLVSKKSIRYAG